MESVSIVKLIDCMPFKKHEQSLSAFEQSIVRSARVSYDKGLKDFESDIKLIKYLWNNNHMTPFEHCIITVYIKCPIFIARQIMRHRTFSYNEVSARYTKVQYSFFLPKQLRVQDKKNKQSSSGIVANNDKLLDIMKMHIKESYRLYEDLLKNGVSREQARIILPQAVFTQFYMTGNLRNWLHFLKLRLDEHAQEEMRDVAIQIESILRDLLPNTMDFFINKKINN